MNAATNQPGIGRHTSVAVDRLTGLEDEVALLVVHYHGRAPALGIA